MSNEHSQPSAADDESAADRSESGDGAENDSESDSLEPGGGPQRVVSDKSVDDILASLDETESAPNPHADVAKPDTVTADTADESGSTGTGSVATTTATSDSLESVTAEFDEDEIPDPPVDEVEAVSDADAASPSEPNATVTATDASDGRETTAAGDSSSVPDGAVNESADIGLESDTVQNEHGDEDLAARVERGEITGADVRAAEAGEGRESTPEIDDVDLSMEDLETGAAEINGGTASSDVGPLAGSIDEEGASNSTATDDERETDDTDNEQGGVLARIKRFFS